MWFLLKKILMVMMTYKSYNWIGFSNDHQLGGS